MILNDSIRVQESFETSPLPDFKEFPHIYFSVGSGYKYFFRIIYRYLLISAYNIQIFRNSSFLKIHKKIS